MMKIFHLLLLEDDDSLGMVLREHLQMNSFDVTWHSDGETGIAACTTHEFDLCLVDIMMPKKDGLTFAREVRKFHPDIPIIFLTAKSLKEDRIEGFKAGCDDYITKPFSIEELLLRIKAVLRRSTNEPVDNQDTFFQIGQYEFDYTRRSLKYENNGRRLTTKEADLLHILAFNKNKTVNRDKALEEIWDDQGYFAGRSMDVYISKLRKYLSDDKSVEIMGIHGKGFRLVVDPQK